MPVRAVSLVVAAGSVTVATYIQAEAGEETSLVLARVNLLGTDQALASSVTGTLVVSFYTQVMQRFPKP